MEILGHIITFILSATIGYCLSPWVSAPRRWIGWVAWVVGLIIVGYIGVDTALISLFGFAVRVNVMLQGLVFGLLVGMLARKRLIAA
jgi:hypothetical protein